ncbi:hypothetical protein [Lederbergia lenta]|uniref:hypothetical protein n=1 Tax=Lederbergia lenta TaxID=1467 RepID=UPI00203E9179|nr:hypothetical protein [Lederbergia lenta]MCM3111661.1 hypothetical protein [Lederbergia lenta]
MKPTLSEQLKEWKKDHMQMKQQRKKPQKRCKEKLSFQEVEGLMGMGRPIYGRGKGGAIRQK